MDPALRRAHKARRLVREIEAAAISPTEASRRALEETGSEEAGLEAWVSAALAIASAEVDDRSKLSKGAIAVAVLAATTSEESKANFQAEGALLTLYPRSSAQGCQPAAARAGRYEEEACVRPGHRMVALAAAAPHKAAEPPPVRVVLQEATLLRQPRRERLYDTEFVDASQFATPMFQNFTSFTPPTAFNPTLDGVLIRSLEPPARVAIGVKVLLGTLIAHPDEDPESWFHVPELDVIERAFDMGPPYYATSWERWVGPRSSALEASADVVRVDVEVARAWAHSVLQ